MHDPDDIAETAFAQSTTTSWNAEGPLSAALPSLPSSAPAPAFIEEVNDSEDEDSEREVLQLQNALADAKARLAQLEMDPRPFEANCMQRMCCSPKYAI